MVIGGLVSATALTLFVLPVLYAIVEERRQGRTARLVAVQRPVEAGVP